MVDNSSKKLRWFLPLSAGLALAVYLLFAWRGYGLGYPLDDAWIHQTYARNMATYGEWMFLPGFVSGGSTSPLWTLTLTPSHLFEINPLIWTTLLGFCLLTLLGWLSYIFLKVHGISKSGWWIAGIIMLEWHFVWAALSGMETLLQTVTNLGIAVLLYQCVQKTSLRKKWFLLGVIIGSSVWVRPDSITWIGPVVFLSGIAIIQKKSGSLPKIGLFMLGLIIPICAYLLFNLQIAGSIWPNTMYAKQAEYQAHLDIPFISRFLQLFILPFIGSTFLLLPGIIYYGWRVVKERNYYLLSLFLWWLGMVVIYALRLPVTYQHGRYMIPTMIIPMVLGLLGTMDLYHHLSVTVLWKERIRFAGKALFIGLQIAFLVLGAQAFQKDVGVIETEMVETALWIRDNLPQNAVLAVHDIGAMGYYSERSFYDLAGLINPEVIPIIRDEVKLAEFLDTKDVEYIVVFPSWYETMLSKKEVYYSTGASLSPSLGGENMTIFCWKNCR